MRKLITNGKIYQDRDIFTHALYIEEGIIVATGEDALSYQSSLHPEEHIDAQGHTIVPGFNDAHLHFYQAALALNTVDLYGATSMEELIHRGQAFPQKEPTTPKVLRGRGFNQDLFQEKRLPTRHDLDNISQDFPIIFTRTCSHLAVANSKALTLLEQRGLLQPVAGGQFDLDEEGHPNGIFRENAIPLLETLYEEVSEEDVFRTLQRGAKEAHKEGLTSLQVNDIWYENKEAQAVEKAYMRFAKEQSLRIYHQVYFKDVENFKKRVAEGFYMDQDPFNQYGLLKLFADGSLGARTAYMRHPYHDDPTSQGILTMTKESILAFLRTCEEHGIQSAIHVIGDGAIELILDCYEEVLSKGNPLRHGLIHVQITDEALLHRIKSLGLLVYAQPIFIHNDLHIVEDRVGKDLAKTSYAYGTMAKIGIKVSYSTDAPIEKFNVMENLHTAINRQDLHLYPQEGYYAHEAVDRATALDHVTINSAYMSFEEKKKGRLKPGYVSDFVILKDPYFDVPKEKIKDIEVLETFVGGRSVYRREDS